MGFVSMGGNGNNGSATPGANGKSAYEIAVDNGFTGTEKEWLESLKGQDGAPGADGFSPIIKVDKESETEYVLEIITNEGSFKTPNLKYGGSGIDAAGLNKITEVIKIADKINRGVV